MGKNLYDDRMCISNEECYLVKVLNFTVILVSVIILNACSESNTSKQNLQPIKNTEYYQKASGRAEIDVRIRRNMERLRKNLPTEKAERFGEETIPIDVDMDDNYFYYIDEIDDTKSEFFSYDAQTRKEIHREYLITVIPSMKSLVLQLLYTDRGIVFRFVASSSGMVKDIVYSKEELQGILTSSELLIR